MTTTPNMDLVLPEVEVTPGPEWASEVNDAFEEIDSHDHSTGKGVKINPTGLNINSDLPFGSNNATLLRTTRYVSQSTQLSAPSDVGCYYVLNGEMMYRDLAGNNVQITSNGGINISSVGTIGGDYGQPGVPASVIYTDLLKTFIFTRDTGIGAIISGSSLQLTHPLLGEQAITIAVPSGATSYTLTLPGAAPAVNSSLLSIDSSGAASFTSDISIQSIALNSGAFVAGYNFWFDGSARLRINGDAGGILWGNAANDTTLMTLTDAGLLALTNATDSSSISTGSLVTAGGLGIAKKLFVGTDLSVGGNITSGSWAATTIAVNRGGTGLTSYAVGDLLYASGAAALSKLAGVATGNALISGGVTTAPSWGKIGLTTHVSGVLPLANGGTNATTKAGAFDSLSPMTAAGDIIYGGASGTGTRLAAGAANTVLIAGTTPSYALLANANISASAAIAGTKISPDFGSQNIVTTGTVSASNLIGATYTPSPQNLSNAVTITMNVALYTRVRNIVTVFGSGTVGSTLAAQTQTSFRITLPIASELTGGADVAGSGARLSLTGTDSTPIYVTADVGANQAILIFNSISTSVLEFSYSFQYEVK